jgi:hypothetical protein
LDERSDNILVSQSRNNYELVCRLCPFIEAIWVACESGLRAFLYDEVKIRVELNAGGQFREVTVREHLADREGEQVVAGWSESICTKG